MVADIIMDMGIVISMNTNNDLALTRLFQLISPSLPIGSYTYSQGIEWAVEQGWINDEIQLRNWLQGLLESTMLYVDLPLLIRFIKAWSDNDLEAVAHWNEYLIASRETAELRLEEANRARAFSQVLISLEPQAKPLKTLLLASQHACFSYACYLWGVNIQQACYGLMWSWLENQALSAVKIIPLGQTAGQQVIYKLCELFPDIIQRALLIEDDDLGASSMAQVIASSRHEDQYTRLFRS